MEFEFKGIGPTQQLAPLQNDAEVVQLLQQTRQWHQDGQVDRVAASDTALNTYFRVSSALKKASLFANIFNRKAGVLLAEAQTASKLKRLFKAYPVEALDLILLPLPTTQALLGVTAQLVAQAAGYPLSIVAGTESAVTRAIQLNGSLFDSPTFKTLSDEKQTAEERAEQLTQFSEYRTLMDASQCPAETIASFNLEPRDLFRFFHHLAVHRATARVHLPAVFAALCEAIYRGDFDAMPQHAEFLITLARREPSINELMGHGDDRVYLRVNSADGPVDYAMSRFLLYTSGPFFPELVASAEWTALDRPTRQLPAKNEVNKPRRRRRGQKVKRNRLPLQDARVINLQSFQMVNADTCKLLYDWLTLKSLPCPRADMTDQQLHLLITQIASLSAQLHVERVHDLSIALSANVTDDSLVGMVTMGQRIRMPSLLIACCRFITNHYGNMVQLVPLPDGSYKLKLKKSKNVLPAHVATAVKRLASNVTHLTVQQAMEPLVLSSVLTGMLKQAVTLTAGQIVQVVRNTLVVICKEPRRIDARSMPVGSSPFLTALLEDEELISRVRILDLTKCFDLNDHALLYMIRRLTQVQTLMLGSAAPLTAASFDHLSDFRRLNKLRLTTQEHPLHFSYFNELNLQEQSANLPDLQVEMHVQSCGLPPRRFFERMHDVNVSIASDNLFCLPHRLVSRCASLQLESVSSLYLLYLSSRSVQTFVASFPRLRSITLLHVHPQDIQELAKLRFLTQVTFGEGVDDAGLRDLVAGLPELEDVSLLCSRITDTGLAYLTKLKKLQRLLCVSVEVTDAGVKGFRERRPDVELTLYLANMVSAAVLAPTVRRTSPATLAQQAKIEEYYRHSFKETERLNEQTQSHLQSACHAALDVVIQNRCFMDYPWPNLSNNPELNALIPAMQGANLETFKTMLQTQLNLEPAYDAANRSVEIPMTHLRFLAQLFQNKDGIKLLKELNQTNKPMAVDSPMLESFAALKAIWPEMHNESSNLSTVIPAVAHGAPAFLQEHLLTVIEALSSLSLIDFRVYLRTAFPRMNQQVTDRLLNQLSARIHAIAKTRADDIAIIAQSASAASLDGLRCLIALVTEGGFSEAYKHFLDGVRAEADRGNNMWTDQQRLALALGGLLESFSLLPIVARAARHEPFERKDD